MKFCITICLRFIGKRNLHCLYLPFLVHNNEGVNFFEVFKNETFEITRKKIVVLLRGYLPPVLMVACSKLINLVENF